MPCRTPGCGCGFISETLNISEVSPGVWQFEQAEFTAITELQDKVAQLEADMADVLATLAMATDNIATLNAKMANRMAITRSQMTPAAVSGIAATPTNVGTLNMGPFGRNGILWLDYSLYLTSTASADVSTVYLQGTGIASGAASAMGGGNGLATRMHSGIGWQNMGPSTAASVSLMVQRSSGTGTITTAGTGRLTGLFIPTPI